MIERQYGFIEVTAKDHGAAWITLKNPVKKNAIGPAMVNELLWALEDAAGDDTVRSVVLTGAGDAFCAGGDFTQMASFGPGSELPPKGDYADLLSAMTNYPKPIISRVNGHAMGGGLGLVAASHFAVASRNAKLGTPEINVGLFPMMIMAVLARIVPQRRLLEMMLFGERVDADAAVGLGLVNKAVDTRGCRRCGGSWSGQQSRGCRRAGRRSGEIGAKCSREKSDNGAFGPRSLVGASRYDVGGCIADVAREIGRGARYGRCA